MIMAASVILWWPVLSPAARAAAGRLPVQLLYLFVVGCPWSWSPSSSRWPTACSTRTTRPRPRVWERLTPARRPASGRAHHVDSRRARLPGAISVVFFRWQAAGGRRRGSARSWRLAMAASAPRALDLDAVVAVFLLMTIGNIVSATGSGLACPDWPLCHGSLIPPLQPDVLIEYSHRLAALAASLLLVATIVTTLAWRARGERARGHRAAGAARHPDRAGRRHGAAQAAPSDQHGASGERSADLRRAAAAGGGRGVRPGRSVSGRPSSAGSPARDSACCSSSSRWGVMSGIRARDSPVPTSRCAAATSCPATGWQPSTGSTAGSASSCSASSPSSPLPPGGHRWRCRPPRHARWRCCR